MNEGTVTIPRTPGGGVGLVIVHVLMAIDQEKCLLSTVSPLRLECPSVDPRRGQFRTDTLSHHPDDGTAKAR
jgi:hypothetical protein